MATFTRLNQSKMMSKVPTAPRFKDEPTISKNDFDNEYTISFSVFALPRPTFAWTKNNKRMTLSSKNIKTKVEGSVPEFKVSLNVSNFSNVDAGEYRCQVKNSLGELTASARLSENIEDASQSNDDSLSKTDGKQMKMASSPSAASSSSSSSSTTSSSDITLIDKSRSSMASESKQIGGTSSNPLLAAVNKPSKESIDQAVAATGKASISADSSTIQSKTAAKTSTGQLSARSKVPIGGKTSSVSPRTPVADERGSSSIGKIIPTTRTETQDSGSKVPALKIQESMSAPKTSGKQSTDQNPTGASQSAGVLKTTATTTGKPAPEPSKPTAGLTSSTSSSSSVKMTSAKKNTENSMFGSTTSAVGMKQKTSAGVKTASKENSKTSEVTKEGGDKVVPTIAVATEGSAAPFFSTYPENKTMTEGTTGLVEAVVGGKPFPKVSWFRGRTELVSGPRYQEEIVEKSGRISLKIVRPKTQDDDTYSIRLTNSKGKEECQFRIFVTDKNSTSLNFREGLRSSISGASGRSSSKEKRRSKGELISDRDSMSRDSSLESSDRKSSVLNWKTSLKKTEIKEKAKDEWTDKLEDSEVHESEGVAVLSATFCKPGGRLRWYKNRVEIFHGLKYSFSTNGAVQTLKIHKLHPDDSGRYMCSVNDIETRAWLTVTAAKIAYDFYKMLPAKLEVFRTATTILECHVSSPDTPVKWLKDKTEVKAVDKRIKMYIDGARCILRMQRTVKTDAGVYTCQINDEIGDKKTICYLYVLEPQWRFRKKLPTEIVTDENKNAVFEVEVEDKEAECEWFYKGELVHEDTDQDKFIFESDGHVRRMIVKNADVNLDSGKYECRTGVMASTTNLRIKPKLKIVKHLSDTEAKEDGTLMLSVKLNMQRKLVLWYKDGHQLQPNGRVKININDCLHSLAINEITTHDAGSYSARIEDLEETCAVKVSEAEKPPSIDITRFPKKINIKLGDPLKIVMFYKGNPQPTCHWLFNGKPVKAEYVKFDTENRQAIIEIPMSKRTDSGVYELTLESPMGGAKANVNVTVSDLPGPPVGPVNVEGTTRSSCSFSWKPPKDDGGAPVEKYIVEKQDPISAEWTVVSQLSADRTCAVADGLQEGKMYHFRVKAVNRNGCSAYLETTESVEAKDRFKRPQNPTDVKVVNCTSDSVELKWDIPESDGGAPIEKYIVEMKPKASREWKEVNEVTPDKLTAVVPKLTEQTEYEFRVKATNKAGTSEASPSSGSCCTAPKAEPPRIDKTVTRTITVKEGDKICLESVFRANPLPTMTWTKDGEVIDKDTHYIPELKDNLATIRVDNAKKTDSGVYLLTLRNEVGVDTRNFEVKVVGKPSSPKGPLDIYDIYKSKVSLKWDSPEDDGGSPVDNYIIERRKIGGQWIKVGETSAKQYTVSKLREGEDYEFRVSAHNNYGVSDFLTHDQPITTKDPYDVPKRPETLKVINQHYSFIEIQWTEPADNGGAGIQGYIIERFNQMTQKWKRLNSSPTMLTNFKDNTVNNNTEYEYRVKAINVAGESEPSVSTGTVIAKPDKELPSIDFSTVSQIRGRNEIHVQAGEPLTINLPIGGTPKPDICWAKSDQPLKTNDRIEITSTTEIASLNIPCCVRTDSGQYKITLYNEVGHEDGNINVIVHDVPSPCKGPITIKNISDESVGLEWSPPDDDGGSPIDGYTVEARQAGTEIWKTVVYDTLLPRATVRNLDKKTNYDFRVRAKNRTGSSEPLETNGVLVKSPYDVPSAPSIPRITEFDDHFITIEWDKPENDGGSHIEGYQVEMQEDEGDWNLVDSRTIHNTSYMVSNVEPNSDYRFRVKAVNDAGPGELSMPSSSQKAQCPMRVAGCPLSPIVSGVTCNSVNLSWPFPSDDGGSKITGFIIEKTVKGSDQWEPAKAIDTPDTKVCIDNLNEGDDVAFRLIAVNPLGISEASKPTPFVNISQPNAVPEFPDLTTLNRTVTVNAGKPVLIEIPYKSIPQGSVVLDRIDGGQDGGLKCEADGSNIRITCDNAKRPLTGQYKVTLKNPKGSTSTKFNLNVLDVPFAPHGPLKPTYVDAEKCSLSWNAPVDDGGKEVIGYVIEKRLVNSDDWVKACPSTKLPKCDVNNLENGKRYDFRVRAENVNGLSEPLQTTDSVKAKWSFNEPGEPISITCKNRGPGFAVIEWKQPKDDGGSPITGYMVEYSPKDSDNWIPLNKYPISDNDALIPNLSDNEYYKVRVSAVNKSGLGQWHEIDEPLQARLSDEVPHLYGFETGSKDVKVMRGTPLTVRIPYTGSPQPTVKVTKGGKDVSRTGLVKIDVDDGVIKIKSDKAMPEHDGTFTVTVKNDAGTDEGTLKINVNDAPSSPTGPLEVSNCHPDGCTLSWTPPIEDGGETVSNYIIEAMDTKVGDWGPLTRTCRDTTYEAFDLIPDRAYKYRVRAVNIHGTSEPLETDSAINASYPFNKPSAPSDVSVSDVGPAELTIQWARPDNDGGNKISGYRIEYRRPAAEGIWQVMDTVTGVEKECKVKHLRPGEKYEFRVSAKNDSGFGQSMELPRPITTKQRPTKPTSPNVPTIDKIKGNEAILSWDMPLQLPESTLSHYIVEGRRNSDLNWTPVLETTSSENVVIPNLIENSVYQFRVKAVNPVGQSEPSDGSLKIKATDYPDAKAPEFNVKLKDMVVSPNKSAVFSVGLDFVPPTEVKWFRNNVPIVPGVRSSIRNTDQGSELTFHDIIDTDDGAEITCTVSNPLGSETTSCHMSIDKIPVISKYPTDQVVNIGEPLRVKIPVEGSATFEIILMKDGQPVRSSKDLKIVEVDGTIVLNIPECSKDDSGVYSLTVKNPAGDVHVNFNVNIVGKPDRPGVPLVSGPTNDQVCTISWATPRDTGGTKITHYVVEKIDLTSDCPQWKQVPVEFKENKAEIPRLLPDHEYQFRVKAANNQGESDESTVSNSILIESSTVLPNQPGEPHIIGVIDGLVQLKWNRPEPNDAMINGYFVEKRDTSIGQWVRVNIGQPQTNTQMDIPNLMNGHTYQFRVIASSDNIESIPSANSEPVQFRETQGAAPTIEQKLNDCTVDEGKVAKLKITVTGEPQPEITWYKDDVPIFDNSKYAISKDGNTFTLTINDVDVKDADSYVVKARNNIGSRSSRAMLSVNTRPRIKMPERYEKVINFEEGQNVELKIPYAGKPQPEVKWTCRGRSIMDDSRVTVENTDRYTILRIRNAHKDDTGPYTLTLTNNVGDDSKTVNLSVVGVPDRPRFLTSEYVDDNSVMLTWTAPVDNGGSKNTNYILEKKEVDQHGPWTRSGFCGPTTKFTVPNLQSGHLYKFRVIAENINGRSAPSEPTSEIQVKEKKERLPISAPYGYDEDGHRVRGLDTHKPTDYDKCYTDSWKLRRPVQAATKSSEIYEDYDVFEEIGKSPFGPVRRAVDRSTGKSYAVKFLSTPNNVAKMLVKQEILTMNDLIDESLLHLKDVYDNGEEVLMVTEFLSGPDLVDKLSTQRVTEADAASMIRQVCQGLAKMHDNNYVHLNIKPECLIFNNKKDNDLKITNSNLAKRLSPNEDIKVSLDDIKFSAPEIVNNESIGFYTDMYGLGSLAYFILSGEAPFGDDDNTRERLQTCDLKFPKELGFDDVSDEAKDFIRKLVTKDKGKRMTAHEALNHTWLNDKCSETELHRSQYTDAKEKINAKYKDTRGPRIGRISNFSNLLEQHAEDYQVEKRRFDNREAAPRFVISMTDAYTQEGETAEFVCRVISLTPPKVTWHRHGDEIRQSVKYSKKSQDPAYTLEIKKCTIDDQGRYSVKAENYYGDKTIEKNLTVYPAPRISRMPVEPQTVPIKHLKYSLPDVWEEPDSAPQFTYHLRSRVIQRGQSVKLSCAVSGKPSPTVKWYKDDKEITDEHANITFDNTHGVNSIDLLSVSPDDSGCYKCVAENNRGSAETAGQVLVIGGPSGRRDSGYTITYETTRSSSRGISEGTPCRESYQIYSSRKNSREPSIPTDCESITDSSFNSRRGSGLGLPGTVPRRESYQTFTVDDRNTMPSHKVTRRETHQTYTIKNGSDVSSSITGMPPQYQSFGPVDDDHVSSPVKTRSRHESKTYTFHGDNREMSPRGLMSPRQTRESYITRDGSGLPPSGGVSRSESHQTYTIHGSTPMSPGGQFTHGQPHETCTIRGGQTMSPDDVDTQMPYLTRSTRSHERTSGSPSSSTTSSYQTYGIRSGDSPLSSTGSYRTCESRSGVSPISPNPLETLEPDTIQIERADRVNSDSTHANDVTEGGKVRTFVPGTIGSMSEMNVVENGTMQLRCSFTNLNESVTASWFKDGELISPSARFRMTTERGVARLDVDQIHRSDQGVFRCRIQTPTGSFETDTLVIVKASNAQSASLSGKADQNVELESHQTAPVQTPVEVQTGAEPTIIGYLMSKSVLEGHHLELECTVDGMGSDFQCAWDFLGNKQPTEELKCGFDGRNRCWLSVRKMNKSMEGQYTMVIKSKHTNKIVQESHCSVFVKDGKSADVEIIEFPRSVSCSAGETTQFQCKVKSKSSLIGRWFFNNEANQLQASDRIAIKQDKSGSSFNLQIKRVSRTDHGVYKLLLMKNSSTTVASLQCDMHVV